jgi:hypothetical protein
VVGQLFLRDPTATSSNCIRSINAAAGQPIADGYCCTDRRFVRRNLVGPAA